MTHSLECPNCGEEVFEREENLFGQDEEQTCECGAQLLVDVDDSEIDDEGNSCGTVSVTWVNEDDMDYCEECCLSYVTDMPHECRRKP